MSDFWFDSDFAARCRSIHNGFGPLLCFGVLFMRSFFAFPPKEVSRKNGRFSIIAGVC